MFLLAFVIEFLSLLKNLDFSNTFLDGHTEIEGESLIISAALLLFLPKVKPKLIFGALEVNLFTTVFLKELLYLSTGSEFQPAL